MENHTALVVFIVSLLFCILLLYDGSIGIKKVLPSRRWGEHGFYNALIRTTSQDIHQRQQVPGSSLQLQDGLLRMLRQTILQ